MSQATAFRRRRPARARRPVKTRLEVEVLESRCVLSSLNLSPLVQLSGASPYPDCLPSAFTNAETEPYVAVDPTDPNHLVGAWIQDGSRGIGAAVTFDGGQHWEARVVPGLSVCSGGIYDRAADPWVAFAPNGDVYLSSLTFDFGGPNSEEGAILISKSADGGLTWGAPVAVTVGKADYVDKESITADPTNSQFAYVTWARFSGSNVTTMFSRTTDGGQTWEPARKIFDSGNKDANIGHQILVLPDGTLINLFTDLVTGSDANGVQHYEFNLSLIRSTDQGQTWLPQEKTPIHVAEMMPLSGDTFSRLVPNPDGGNPIIAPFHFADFAVDPHSGALYAVWQDARFSDSQHYSIAFAMSTDGGLTWSAPIRINQTPDDIRVGNQQTFLPSVAVAADGTVAVTYYDFRNNTPEPGLLTDYWMVHAHANLTIPASWASENRLTNTSFDMTLAPGPVGSFLGDYQGLVAAGNRFGAFFAMPHRNPDGTIDPASIFFRDPLPAEGPADWDTDDHDSDLRGTTLGLASGNTIWLDDNAAGWGWFVDPTPWNDSEFTTPGDQGEQHRMDLLTVLEHEVGHLLGYDHGEPGTLVPGVMSETLAAGTRLVPTTDALTDAIFAANVFTGPKRRWQ